MEWDSGMQPLYIIATIDVGLTPVYCEMWNIKVKCYLELNIMCWKIWISILHIIIRKCQVLFSSSGLSLLFF